MAGVLVIAIFGSGASGGQSERDGVRSDSGNQSRGGLSPSQHRYTVEGLTTLASRSLDVSRSECPPNAKPVPGGCIPRGAARVVHGERCKSARLAAVYYRNLTHARQRARQGELADRTPIVRGKTCRWARFTAAEWQARATSARRSLESWLRDRLLRDFATSPGAKAWHRAVQEAQRPYPGTAGWLLSCSASEGGWGRWVPNSQGSGVGGWMQMYPSTFWRMFSAAKADLHARGFRVPSSAASWYSPLGQALASAWGLTNGRRHEWHGAGC